MQSVTRRNPMPDVDERLSLAIEASVDGKTFEDVAPEIGGSRIRGLEESTPTLCRRDFAFWGPQRHQLST